MNITPVNYNYLNQKNNNQPSFNARLRNLEKFTESLREVLPYGETDAFLDAIRKSAGEIREINFKNTNVEIGVDKVENLKHSFNFTVVSKLMGAEGDSDSEVKISKWFKQSGKNIAKKFINAAKDATDYIIESPNYLKGKAAEVTKSVNAEY